MKQKKDIITYILLGLMGAILIAAGIASTYYSGTRLSIIWMGAALLEINLIMLLVFLRRNLR